MRKLRVEVVGAALAIVTGALVMVMVGALFPLVPMIDFFAVFSKAATPRPFITVGLSGGLYSLAIVALGALALHHPKWGGAGLLLCALAGYLLGSGNLTLPLLLLTAAILCLFGRYKDT
jgi:hypothetical protein